jgi:RND family efflux transporter MFP subunit
MAAGGSPGGGARTAIAVNAAAAERGTIENSVVINGDVLARTQVSIYPTVGGKITETRFKIGDAVRQGEVMAMVNPSRPGEVYSNSPVLSTISGTVLQAPVNPGDTVNLQDPVYVVGDLSSLALETFVPERFSQAVRPGLSAWVTLESLPGETFRAVVEEVSPVLDPASRTLRIRLAFRSPEGGGRADPRIKAGMFATLSLVTNARQDVTVIRRESAINRGSWIVFVVDGQNIARRREILPGLENETHMEIIRGLEPGELVVTAGQNFLSDGDPVRIVE